VRNIIYQSQHIYKKHTCHHAAAAAAAADNGVDEFMAAMTPIQA